MLHVDEILQALENIVRVVRAHRSLEEGVRQRLVGRDFLCLHRFVELLDGVELAKVEVHLAEVLVSVDIVLDAVFVHVKASKVYEELLLDKSKS